MRTSPAQQEKLLFISPGLLIAALLFAAGICWAVTLYVKQDFLIYGAVLLLLLLFIIYKSRTYRNRARQDKTVLLFFLGLLFFLLGLLHGQRYMNHPAAPGHIYNLVKEQQTVTLEGMLLKYPSVAHTSSGPESRLLMRVNTLYQPAGPNPQGEQQKRTAASGRVLLTLKGAVPEDLEPGNRFLVKTNVSPVSTYSTPGAFNYKEHLANQGILLKGWIQSPGDILRVSEVASSPLASAIAALRYLPERLRCHIGDFLDRSLPQPARGLYKAILIGDRNDVPVSVLDDFTGAGCIHILAISGMHMGLLALVTIAFLTWLLKRSTWLLLHAPVPKIAVSLALLPLLLYAFIAGFNIPVLRALLMTTVFILAILFDRPGNLINHILLAALLILAWKPGAIFTASFQLSFSAVIAIALIYPLLYRFLAQETTTASGPAARPAPRTEALPPALSRRIFSSVLMWILAGLALTTAAMLGTAPLLLFHFNRLSLAAPLSNLLVEPLICFWSLIMGLLASICIPLFPPLAKILFITGSYGLTAAGKICTFFASLPLASLWFPTPSPEKIMFAYLLLLSSAVTLHLRRKQNRFSLFLALFFLCSLLAAPAVITTARQPTGLTTVTFLDVGHGSSMLLQLQGNNNILIDGGGPEGDRFNIGERVIGPFLWYQGLDHLDAVVVTHPHADHYNGLPFILSRFRPKKLWISGVSGPDKEYRELLALAAQLGIETRIAEPGSTLFESGSTRLLCLHSGLAQVFQPDISRPGNPVNPNDLSLVLRLETEGRAFLFPADISARMAARLVNDGIELQADVLMAPHHGSSSSMSQEFIGTVAPEYIAISAGRNNPFNFPAKSFYELQKKGIEVLTTGREGTITFTLKNGELTVSNYQVN